MSGLFFTLSRSPSPLKHLLRPFAANLKPKVSVCSEMRLGPRRRCGCPNVEVMAVGLDGHVAAALGDVGGAAAIAKCNAPSHATTSVRCSPPWRR